MGTFDKQMSEPSNQKSLDVYMHGIDRLTEPQADQDYGTQDITRRHWKQWDGKTVCSNRSCRKPFSLLDRVHHCRRCGNIFCNSCLKFRRKLNKLANLDPDGRSYKVCQSCYAEGQETEGRMVSLMDEFRTFRMFKYKNSSVLRGHLSSSRRDKFDFEKECRRLIEGFKGSMGSSEVKRTLHELRNMVSIPEWQKASMWMQENLSDCCHMCRSTFGFLRKKLFCRVCGLALCKGCSAKDLLVYFPDVEPGEQRPADPRLAIIKIIGCPEVEPEVSLYLRACPTCREQVIERQISQMEAATEDDPSSELMPQLTSINASFHKTEMKVKTHLPEYQEIIDSLEDNSRGSSGSGSGLPKSNMKTLAKAQGDLADFLAKHVLIVQQLKRLKPQTETQNKLLKNYIKSKCDFYLENMSTFRASRNRLSDTTPPEVLEFIQKVMDKNAIVSAHLYLRQLVFETIALCAKFHLDEEIPRHLTPLEEALELDVRVIVEKDGEDWNQHDEITQQLIKEQMRDHKLIRPSRRQLKKHGASHAEHIMQQRSRDVLASITVQLQLKSANRSFPQTKKCLDEAINTYPGTATNS
ncbi:uncharacterized protein [Haliotis asinina]|uniref:uncharacterized protein n=1 Tax=Haliotis asinina TaxID=109174 RepID=UPI0035325178